MVIRPYDVKDKEDVRNVCVITAHGIETDMQKAILWNLFCDYYINEEPDCCFVAADEEDKAGGYIIASADYGYYERTYREKYLKELKKLKFFDGVSKSLDLWYGRRFAHEYPAHLHIDIDPKFQRMGLGHKLMNALVLRLDEKNVSGVYLIVGKNNEKGVNFYKKYGFVQIGKILGAIVFGLKVREKAEALRENNK